MAKHKHPSHKSQLSKLNRAKGQIEAVGRMIDEERYCVDIITQIRAARAALKTIELEVLETHMGACVVDACSAGSKGSDKKIQEIMNVLKKYE